MKKPFTRSLLRSYKYAWLALGAIVVIGFGVLEGTAITIFGTEATASANMWKLLSQHEAIWGATLGIWAAFVIWATGHIFFRRW